ncbi:hypothetical protein PoB_000749300 [Plakobranchus ocellatus]|uniref:Uncharacterized protein n=1 Tax=Plakobranchus ocellatus TaxID=259542 RepID=A0AAV3YET5_9GAST|nr:hypothetical protein PoB_000749300 [Plakobranchus ocellatus]
MLVPTYDWQSFLGPYFKPLRGIKSLFHFRFVDGATVFARTTDGEELEYQLLKELSNPPPRQLPEPLSPPRLSPERSKYLFQNRRQFVREDCQDILCPAVPE